ncbi:MAG TPA: alpha/beta fold hydrolase [Dehalococcoidales bacterium]|nr:alpha/beta fold hydrolase [Dehalococcoidales bacterium]
MSIGKTYSTQYSDLLSQINNVNVDVAPSKYEVIDKLDIFKLVHYFPLTEKKYSTPILIVCSFINRPYVLDLHEDISVIQKYLKAGFDVYSVDWGYPTHADKFLDLDDYVDFIDRCVSEVQHRNSVSKVTLHGYCLGGTLTTVYAALYGRNVKNLILQAAPIDFDTTNTVALWAKTLDPAKIVDIYHVMPGEFLNVGFLLLDPLNLLLGKYENLLDMISSEGIASFLRMEQWIFDSPSVPGEAFQQFIKQWYQDNLIIKGKFEVLGQNVDLKDINVPVLVLAARFDHIVPPSSQKAIINLISSKDKDVFEIDKGHIGLTTSKDCHRRFWPKVVEWIQHRSEPLEDSQKAKSEHVSLPVSKKPSRKSTSSSSSVKAQKSKTDPRKRAR